MNKTLLFLCLSILGVLNAQVPKKVLLEHFTNTSCGPCAAQNPGFEANIISPNNLILRHISYHPWWPSATDPFYVYNINDNRNRTTYYAVSGVPDVAVNGNRAQGQPASITQSLVDEISAETSPIEVVPTWIDNGTDRTIKVVVKTVGDKPTGDYILHTVVIEKEVNFTTPAANGEKHFPNVMRKMFPSSAGQAITLGEKGTEISQTFTYTEDPTLQLDKLEVICFVQNSLTKEVLNVGSSYDAKSLVTKVPSDNVINLASNASKEYEYSLSNTGTTDDELILSYTSNAPADYKIELFVEGKPVANNSNHPIKAGQSLTFNIKTTTGNSSAIVSNVLSVQTKNNLALGFNPSLFSSYIISNVEDFVVNNSPLAGYRDLKTSSWSNLYTDAMKSNGGNKYGNASEFVLLAAAKGNQLAGIKHIYFNAGWTFPSLTPELAVFLRSFAESGGNVMISGQDVAWSTFDAQATDYTSEEGKSFAREIMGVDYIDDGASSLTSFVPIKTDGIFGSIATGTISSKYSASYFFPDRIKPSPEGTAIFTYNGTTDVTKNSAAVRNTNSKYKTVWLAPGLEQLSSAVGPVFMSTVYKWFHGIISSVDFDHEISKIILSQNKPNPVVNQFTVIELGGISGNDYKFELYTILGHKLLQIPISSQQKQLELNTESLSSGSYLYCISNDRSRTEMKKLIIQD
ncbi:MAG TPA: Omp28-related outer membrane protein [Saprospiraceae bacterium]|nr:Omp28-related outer membrane protein [Saprospiraceae bacterium]